MNLKFLIICLLLNLHFVSFSQSPYEVSWKQEIPFLATAGATLGAAAYLRTLPPLFTSDELLTLDPQDVNKFDRFATKNYSPNADHASDFFWIGSHATPLLLLAGKESRQHFGQIILMYGEAAAINVGITVITKSVFRRTRPFVLNPDAPLDLKLTSNAKSSFVSGHASMTAVNTFFVAKVFSDFYPDSNWKPVVWGGAIVIPAVTAYLRIAAGRHYPTDGIAGYAFWATIGVLVPHLHRKNKLGEKGLSLQTGMNSARLTWRFNGSL